MAICIGEYRFEPDRSSIRGIREGYIRDVDLFVAAFGRWELPGCPRWRRLR